MKQIILLTILSVITLISLGQTAGLDIKSTQKSLTKMNDSLYISQFEVTNKQYSIFLNHLKERMQTEDYLSCQIDSSKWNENSPYNEPFVKYYHTHPAFAKYPVVNISYESAMRFCDWLTDMYNSNNNRKFKKVKFRLPTEKEWIAAANCGNPSAVYPWDGNELTNKKGLLRCNFIRAAEDTMGVAGMLHDNAEITAPVKSYWPNKNGIYNMSGNVAEMIAEKGKTMGGSWLDTADAMKINSEGKFAICHTPMPTIGFRFVMVLIEK
jgi:sulfatase modifying factor 1